MNRTRIGLLLVMGCLLASISGTRGDRGLNQRADISSLRVGMTAAEVRQALGAPNRLSRQLMYHRHREQWMYTGIVEAQLEFLCVPGQEARLQHVWSNDRLQNP